MQLHDKRVIHVFQYVSFWHGMYFLVLSLNFGFWDYFHGVKFLFVFILNHVNLAKRSFPKTPVNFEVWDVLFNCWGIRLLELYKLIIKEIGSILRGESKEFFEISNAIVLFMVYACLDVFFIGSFEIDLLDFGIFLIGADASHLNCWE